MTTQPPRRPLLVPLSLLFSFSVLLFPPYPTFANSLPNPGFEETAGSLPASWTALNVGVESEIALDASEKHSGARSVRIRAREISRSYIRSDPIPVATGERVLVQAWVKHQDVPPGKGTVIAIAEFTNAQDTDTQVAKVNVADTAQPSSQWKEISGRVQVPEQAAFMRLRLGFSYSQGTCWWDDVSVQFEQPLVARLDIRGGRLSPGLGGLPVTIINRAADRGSVSITARLGKETTKIIANLSGEKVQKIQVPVTKIMPGKKVPIEARVEKDGKAVFEDKRICMVPEPLLLLPIVPTHWVTEDGEPRLECRVELALAPDSLAGAVLKASLVDDSGVAHATWTSHNVQLRDGVNDFKLSASELREGKYRVIVELGPNPEQSFRSEQPWTVIPRRLARVTLNPQGFPVYDGQVIFPLGMFNGGARMKEAAEAGFTIAHAYNAVEARLGTRTDDGRAKDFLDQTYAAGMKALMLVPRNLAFHGDWEGVRRRVRMFRNHPGLLAWDEEEGIARGDIKSGTLKQLYELIRSEDPNHPFMVGDSREIIGRMPAERADFFPDEHMDMGMWWWYPIPPGAEGTALEGDEGPRGTELVPPAFLVNRTTQKPVWVGVQSYKKPKTWARYPKPVEYRAQAYIALTHGAKGLMWYGGSVTGGMFLNPEEANWPYLKSLARELRDLTPVLTGRTLASPVFRPAKAALSTIIKQAGGRTVMIAVNRDNRPVHVTFESALIQQMFIPVLGEDRTLNAKAGSMTDDFEPYSAHLYELQKPRP